MSVPNILSGSFFPCHLALLCSNRNNKQKGSDYSHICDLHLLWKTFQLTGKKHKNHVVYWPTPIWVLLLGTWDHICNIPEERPTPQTKESPHKSSMATSIILSPRKWSAVDLPQCFSLTWVKCPFPLDPCPYLSLDASPTLVINISAIVMQFLYFNLSSSPSMCMCACARTPVHSHVLAFVCLYVEVDGGRFYFTTPAPKARWI